jgi:hypothetical protein
VEEPGRHGADRGDEGGPPGAEHDHGPDLDGARDPKPVGMDRSTQALAVGVLEQPDENRGSQEQRQGGVAHTASIGRITPRA